MNKRYTLHPQFIFRTPILPVQVHPLSEQEFFEFTKQSFFKEAIYLASPVLCDELSKWHQNELKDEKAIQKLVISLYKYYTRMQSRCTPYGLFAACAVGAWGDESEMMLEGSSKRHTRLDMNYLCALAQYLNTHPVLLPLLRFYPNNSLYVFGDTIRYVEYKYINNRRIHQISSVDNSDYLQIVLQHARKGALIHELAIFLVDDEVTLEEAESFIKELIQNQLLVSELEPAVTGDEFIYQLIRSLKTIDTTDAAVHAMIESLEVTQAQMKNIDQQIGNDVLAYRSIFHHLQKMGVPIEENQLFQTDLYKTPSTASLDKDIQQQLLDAVNFLNNFSSKDEKSNLKKFRENFYNQYEDSEIALLEVLDTETGIGYTGKDQSGINTLLDDLHIPAAGKQDQRVSWNKQQQFLHDQLLQAAKKGSYTVSFDDGQIKDIGTPTDSLPDTLAIMFRLIDKQRIYLQSCGGSSAANLLGRFAHGDKKISQIINDITAHEQSCYPDQLLAEIVHLPESRVGNILLRPILRNYEIAYLGKSAMPAENQIQLQDLMISVKGNRIILRSKKMNKEIIPRLSTAHNYSFNALPVYQFLCDLQTQYFQKSGLSFNWGSLSSSYKFLPRAEYKNVILARAKWQLSKTDFQGLMADKSADYLKNIAEWRTKWNIPQQVVWVEGDNELLINFEDELSLKMFVSSIKKRDHIVLEEFLFDADDLLVRDTKKNGYVNECIAIGLNRSPIVTERTLDHLPPSVFDTSLNKSIQRSFSIGSEWLYYKLYCGVTTADKLLVDAIRPLVDELENLGWIDQFFFIRYADPDLHLRVRFHVPDIQELGNVIMKVNRCMNRYVEQGFITKIQTDTYRRELERYGSTSIQLSESIFFYR